MRYQLTILILVLFSLSSQAQTLSLQDKKRILDKHNFYRSVVGSDTVHWSAELENQAQKCAQYMADHPLMRCQTTYGINYYKFIDSVKVDTIIDLWAKEQTLYYGQAVTYDNLEMLKHYSQIIWQDTQYIGCALAKNKAGVYILVCLYSPKGNIPGNKPTK